MENGMNKNFREMLLGGMIFSAIICSVISFSADEQKGPTPYPDPKSEKDWAGKGPIRKFNWMDDNRKWFWSQREKDQGAIVFCGDSLTGGWKDLAKAFTGFKVANRGIGGDTSRGLLFRFQEDVMDLNPKAVVINIGTNDLTAMGKADDVISNITDMLTLIEKKNPATLIILCTVPPSDNPKAPIKLPEKLSLNENIKKLAEGKKNIAVCDLYTAMADADNKPKPEYFGQDKLHLAGPGYEKWTETIKPVFEKLGIK